MAALQLRKEFGRNVVRICGTVHDAVLFRVRNDVVKEVHDRMLEIMRWPTLMDDFEISMTVPIEADGDLGPWGKGISIDKAEKIAAFKGLSVGDLLDKNSIAEIYTMWKEAA
jgi:hypothetical protein